MSKKILGLDIRNDSITAVLVGSSLKGDWIEDCVHVPFSDSKDQEEDISRSLETITDRMDVDGAICVAAFPAEAISYRNIQLPFKDKKSIRQTLNFELEPTLPIPVDELIVDFNTFALTQGADKTDLIAAALEKSQLKACLDTLTSFNIDPEIVTIGGYPVVLYLLTLSDVSDNWIFIDSDRKKTSVFFVAAGQICLVRTIRVDSADAARIEKRCLEIQQTLSAFDDIYHTEFQPDRILITGSGQVDPDQDNDMGRLLGLPIQRVNLAGTTNITFQDQAIADSWDLNRMDNALALSFMEIEKLDGFNFRKNGFASKKKWAEYKGPMIKSGLLAGLVLILALFNFLFDAYQMNNKIEHLDRQITEIFTATFPDVKRIVDPLQQMQVKIQAARNNSAISIETGENRRVIDIVNNINRLIPKMTDVEIIRLDIKPENILISGNTDTYNSVDEMKKHLEQGEFFQKVTINSATIDKGVNRLRFKLKIDL